MYKIRNDFPETVPYCTDYDKNKISWRTTSKTPRHAAVLRTHTLAQKKVLYRNSYNATIFH